MNDGVKARYHAKWSRQRRKILRMEKLLISAHAQLEDRELKTFIEWEIQERKKGVTYVGRGC
jgi:hypothetical protein